MYILGLSIPLLRVSLPPLGRFLLCIDFIDHMPVAVASNLHDGSQWRSLEIAESTC